MENLFVLRYLWRVSTGSAGSVNSGRDRLYDNKKTEKSLAPDAPKFGSSEKKKSKRPTQRVESTQAKFPASYRIFT